MFAVQTHRLTGGRVGNLAYTDAVLNGLVRGACPLVAERRPKRRRNVLLPALLACGGGKQVLHCTIRDLSESGARIALSRQPQFPATLYLINLRDRSAHEAKVTWCGTAEAGLAFSRSFALNGITDPALGFLRRIWMNHATR
jgi:hypothetical protein